MQTCVKHLSSGCLATHQIWTQSAQPLAKSGKRVCTCARADALHLRHVESTYLMGPQSHTKFERNQPSRLRDLENGFARAHVQMHSNSDMWKALIWWVSSHTPNLNAIGPAVVELPRERMSPTPSSRHVPRAVADTGGYRCRSNTWLIGWWHRIKMTVCELVIPFQRNPAGRSYWLFSRI